MILNIGKLDPMGPMMFNEELRKYILDNGFQASQKMPFDKSKGEKMWCKDICILHVPSRKVNAYSSYANTKSKTITIFNGLYQSDLEQVKMSDIFWVYTNKETKRMQDYSEFATDTDREKYIKDNK